ncbi:hypothetical protein MIND_00082900 [Mycena indigotica]|uniref:Uncharacterized protein n=1 Tax=Mycena indigotica TaxID=2126181 RepID=A0A8H6TBV5_9AGAR|nr:uncharacterized protein MIND_00082900 [Mycena indigotica]KAF7315673.1 hypothetical protein MIND_00082900 [Mycena indigotica]
MGFVTSAEARQLDGAGEYIVYYWVGLTVQTFFFGGYTLLIWLSTRMLLERRLKTTVNQVMFGLTLFMYLLSLLFWVYSIADGVDRLQGFVDLAKNPGLRQSDHTPVTLWSPLINSVIAINYVISDGVVVWRARVICLRNHRKWLWISIFFLVCTAMGVGIWIAFRIIGTAISPIDHIAKNTPLGLGIDVIQVVILFTSTLSNLSATVVVSATAYRHWRLISGAFTQGKGESRRTNHILVLIVETGAFYCVLALIGLAGSVIRLPQGTLGDLYMPVNVQIAGAYPSIVLLLVSRRNSLNESTFIDSSTMAVASQPIRFLQPSSTGGPISFAPNPKPTTPWEIDPESRENYVNN